MTEPDENELAAFAAELAALRPRADRLDHVRLAYLAGQASVRATLPSPAPVSAARRWAWPVSFAAMTATAAVFGVLLLRSPVPSTPMPSERNTFERNSAEQIANQPVASETPLEWTAAQPGPQQRDKRVLRARMSPSEIERTLALPRPASPANDIHRDLPASAVQPARRVLTARSIDDVL